MNVPKDEKREQLGSALKKINWKLRSSGCGHYQIMDHKGNGTDFEYLDGFVDLRIGTPVDRRGLVSFMVNDINVDLQVGAVTLSNSQSHISFYNFDDF